MMDKNTQHEQWQGYPKELAPGELEAQFANIRNIQFEVALRCGGMNRDWIARQQDGDLPEDARWVGWGFVVNHKCLFVSHGDAMHDPNDKVFIDKLAEEALGYLPYGRQHLEALITERERWIALRDKEIRAAHRDKHSFLSQIEKYRERLTELNKAEATVGQVPIEPIL